MHAVIDMQRVFAEPTAWQVPALPEILPRVGALVRAHPIRTVFTRFETPVSATDRTGTWRRFYERWPSVTLERMDAAMLDVVPELAALAPAAKTCSKTGYSAFECQSFLDALAKRQPDALILSGVETDVCVLATALGAVDRGLHVVVVADAVASWSPAGHRAALDCILPRFDRQLTIMSTADVLAAWQQT
jgi:nicotinamidase-related amidase